MAMKYRILLTKNSLNSIISTRTPDRERVLSFLNFLMSGGWEENPSVFGSVNVWKSTVKQRILFSCEVLDGVFAVWEVLWTTNLAVLLQKSEYGEKEAPHDLSLHILLYSFGEFPGQPEVKMHLQNEDFKLKGSVQPTYLDFFNRKREDEVKYNEELYILAPTRIEDVLRGEQRGLPLHLTGEQAKILGTHRVLRGPILLSGEAGSGKTSVITHWLLINLTDKIRHQLFVTFSERLVDSTKAEFEQMLTTDFGSHGVRFITYRDLLWDIANAGGLTQRDKSKEMTFERFLREYTHNRPLEDIDPVLLWDEIRSVIKGGSLDSRRRLIDYTTYEQLSDKRGRCKAPKGTRKRTYHQAQLYQNYLDERDLWDSIDLAFDCLECLDKVTSYDKIACDEVQDLAPVEIRVLIGLIKDSNIDRIFYTGDTAQVINPSGFTWAKLKEDLGNLSKRRDIRDAWSLGRNFRSTKEIVELVNEVIRTRENILADASGKTIQTSEVLLGLKPMILQESPIKVIKQATTNPQQRLILVKTKKKKDEVRKLLGEAENKVSVLTVEESKGLEWDGVLLWDFFIPRHEIVTKDDWEDIFIPEKRHALSEKIRQDKKNPYGLAYEFNLLHVGLTRARNVLAIYDEDDNRGITALGDKIAEHTMQSNLEVFSMHWKTDLPSPEELYILAFDLLEKDRAQAYRFFKQAAHEYEKKNEFEEAGKCFAKALEYELAARCYKKANKLAMGAKMLALDCEMRMDLEGEANQWETFGELSRESEDWREAYDGYTNAAIAYSKVAESAPSESEKSRFFSKAAKMLELGSGSIASLDNGKWHVSKAVTLYKAAKYWELAESYADAQRSLEGAISIGHEVAKSGEKVTISGEFPYAWIANCYIKMAYNEERQGNLIEAAQYAMSGASSFRSAEDKTNQDSDRETYMDELNDWNKKAVAWYRKGGKVDTAVDVQKKLVELWREREDVHRLNAAWVDLVELLRETGRGDDYIEQSSSLVEHLRAIREKDAAYKLLRKQVKLCEDNEDFECLAPMFETLGRSFIEDEEYSQAGGIYDRLGDLHLRLGSGREAISSFVEAGSNHMKHRMRKAALDSFTRGYDYARAEMNPSSIGWFCFRDVTFNSLVPSNWENEAKKWIIKGVNHFSQDYIKSISRLEEFSENIWKRLIKLEEEYKLEKNNNRKKEINKKRLDTYVLSGWTWLCLAILYQKGLELREAPLGHRENMIQSLTKSEAHFEEAKKSSMISYVKEIRKKVE